MNTKSPSIINRIHKILRPGLLLISLLACGVLLIQPIARNRAFSQALWTVERYPGSYYKGLSLLKPISQEDCRVNWQIISLAYHMANPPDVEANMNNLLSCTHASVVWLLIIAPQRQDLAFRAAQLYPQELEHLVLVGRFSKFIWRSTSGRKVLF